MLEVRLPNQADNMMLNLTTALFLFQVLKSYFVHYFVKIFATLLSNRSFIVCLFLTMNESYLNYRENFLFLTSMKIVQTKVQSTDFFSIECLKEAYSNYKSN